MQGAGNARVHAGSHKALQIHASEIQDLHTQRQHQLHVPVDVLEGSLVNAEGLVAGHNLPFLQKPPQLIHLVQAPGPRIELFP